MEHATNTEALHTYKGSVAKILYHDSTSGYSVLIVSLEKGASLTATGTFPLLAQGHDIQVTGTWIVHPRFGKQFQVQTYYSTTPTSLKGLMAYLSSGFMKGVGPACAERLLVEFGTDILRIIDEEPHKLNRVPGVGPKRIEAIQESWAMHKELAQLMQFLQDKGLSVTYATKLYKRYRSKTISVLRENPYQLIDDIWGIGFVIADDIARKMGIEDSSPQRITAGIRFCLRKAGQQGHLYLGEERLLHDTHDLLHIALEDMRIKVTLQHLYAQHKLVLLTAHQQLFVALPVAYMAEKRVAESIRAMLAGPSALGLSLEQITLSVQSTKTSHMLTQEQKQALIHSLSKRISIITGGPGTGKTTLLSTMLGVLEAHNLTYKLTAPTGKAAKRMSESCQRGATTIHRLLDFDPTTGLFKYQADHPLKAQVIIVDECSMIDIMLAQSLLTALGPRTHLIMLGDVDQLPPVGPGNFFRDCIASKIVPTSHLTRIFRQGEGSSISYNAHRIRDGAYPLAPQGPNADFILIAEPDPTQLPLHLKRIILSEAQQRGCNPLDVTVLCPMHRGAAGTQQMNSFLQGLLNPEKQNSFTSNGTTFKCQDRVMQLRNNYDKMVFNGDSGIITQIDHDSTTFTVAYDEKAVMYQFDEAEEIMLAYAITIHKSQGSEFPVVVVPIFMQHFMLLRRNLLYTALTRARTLCVLVGEKKAIAIALRQIDSTTRITFLVDMLSPQDHTCVIAPSVSLPL